jgi:hypothetical protein
MPLTPENPLSSRFEIVDGYWIHKDMVESKTASTVRCTNNVIIIRPPEPPERA